jgi:hypothetical protein
LPKQNYRTLDFEIDLIFVNGDNEPGKPENRCDREKDYEVAWKEFERRFKAK